MATVTKPIALNESLNTTEQTPRNVADVLAQELARIAGRQASDVDYDNTASGLTADNVQDAIDELKSNIPTVNDGTLTIQQNGETKGTFTANQSGNSTVNIETPTTDIQTAVDEFGTYNGGLLSECIIELVPVQSGSGDPSPDNVRPISGHTQVVVGDDGKNWLKNTASSTSIRGIDYTVNADGTVDADGTSTQNGGIVVFNGSLPNGNYILNGSENGSASTYTIRYNINGGTNINVYSGDSEIIALTDTDVLNVEIRVYQNATLSHVLFKPMIRLASDTDPTFVPYNGYQVTVNLGGTYYFGVLDIVSGVLTITHAFGEYDGGSDENWTINGTGSGQYPFANIAVSDNNTTTSIISNEFTATTIYTSNQNVGVYKSTTNLRVRPDFALTDATAWKTWLSSNPLQVCYPLATPLTIQLSPTMVKALVGENHLSAPLDGQEITESKYKQMFTFDDVIAYIQSLS